MGKLSDYARKNKYAYNTKYMKKMIKQRTISFNQSDPEDMKLYDWIGKQKPSGTQYIKGLVREDMNKAGE